MCNKCIEIDRTIDRYRRIQLSIMDQLTVDRAQELIVELEAQKVALHPEGKPTDCSSAIAANVP